jgi:hypothetical protein
MTRMELVELMAGFLWVYRCPACHQKESKHLRKNELATFPVPYCNCDARLGNMRRFDMKTIIEEQERTEKNLNRPR